MVQYIVDSFLYISRLLSTSLFLVHYALSWEDPILSITFVLYGLSIYIAYIVLDYPILSVVLWLSFLSMLYSGIIYIIRIYQLDNKLPPNLAFLKDKPRIAINNTYIQNFCIFLSDYIITKLLWINDSLQWINPYQSIKIITYLWLSIRYIYLFSLPYLLFYYLVLFGLLPLYYHFQSKLDHMIMTIVVPNIKLINDMKNNIENLIFSYYKLYPLVVPLLFAIGTGTLLWILWDWWNILSLMTFISFLIICVDQYNTNIQYMGIISINDSNKKSL